MAVEQLITEHLDVWSSSLAAKSTAGRGASKRIEQYGIRKLRELILELAVRGKLVSQEPSDEPASELVKRITARKIQLIAEKKIKKTGNIAEIISNEKKFDLPIGWDFLRLGQLGEIFTGNSISAREKDLKYSNLKNGLPYIATKDVGYGIDKFNYNNGVLIPSNESKFKVAKSGSVLICSEGGSAGKKCGLLDRDVCFGNKLFALKPLPGVLSKYLLYVYMSPDFYRQFSDLMTGIIGGISLANFSTLVIAVPPEDEQRRIVAKVDELMTLCDHLEKLSESSIDAHQQLTETLLQSLTTAASAEELIANWKRIADNFDLLLSANPQGQYALDQLKQTILQLAVKGKLVPQDPSDEPASQLLKRIAVKKAQLIKNKKITKQKPLPPISDDEKPFELPGGWEWCHLQSLISVMDAGWSPACPPEPSPSNDIWGVLKTTAVQSMQYLECENKVFPDSKEPRPQYEVRAGDILITRAGPKNRVGVCCLVKETRPKLMISDKIIRFHLVEVGLCERYISLCLNTGATAGFIERSKSGMAESQMNISQNKLREAPIPICSIEEQKRIVAKVDQLMALCDQLRERLQAAQKTQSQIADALVSKVIGDPTKQQADTKELTRVMKISTVLSLNAEKFGGDAVIAPLLLAEDGSADAKKIWGKTKFTLPEFYAQLKAEIDAGYIAKPAKAEIIEE